MSQMEVVIVAIGRSPVGKARKGCYARLHPVDLAAQTLNGVLEKVPQLKLSDIGDVVIGCAQPQDEQGFNVARLIIQRAGLPDCVTAQTINRFCSSGLQSIATCANAILAGQEDVMIAGGVESMSMVDMTKTDPSTRNEWLIKEIPGVYASMGITAENVAKLYDITRQEMELFAVESHQKAGRAQKTGLLNDYIIPIKTVDENGQWVLIEYDEGIRMDTNLEKLSTLKPCFKEDGIVTAATSSQVSDAAGFTILMSSEKAEELGIKPIAKFVGFATGGVPADIMGIGPIAAVPKVLKKTKLTMEDVDVIELNEAFAAQAIPCIRKLNLDINKVNPYGGAIALGHPMGATGIFLTCKALTYLKNNNGKYGMITMCIGGGMGAAGIFKLC